MGVSLTWPRAQQLSVQPPTYPDQGPGTAPGFKGQEAEQEQSWDILSQQVPTRWLRHVCASLDAARLSRIQLCSPFPPMPWFPHCGGDATGKAPRDVLML